MEHRMYSDAMTNYLVLRCPQDAQNGYQYRMLAVNRIKGLLPCSFRTIDGEHFLYYGITSRQSVARMYDHRLITGEELRKILYSMAGMIHTLSEFLLDPEKLLLDPEYIFFDYEEERYFYTYYPEPQGKSRTELFEYLSERTDENDHTARIVIYRLCELSETPNFVLREKLLDHEYRMAEVGEDAGESETSPLPSLETSDGKSEENEDDPFAELPSEAEKKKNSGGISPGKLLGIAIFFFASAAGLWISGYWIEFTEEELFGVRAGILCCLILAVAATLTGMILSWKNGKRNLEEEQKKKEEKRKNAMVQTEE